jgi:purine-binding chemotaxis protein CheW
MTPAEILRSRAKVLAQRRQSTAVDPDNLDVLEFRLANESYAIECSDICEVIPLIDLTPVPCTPPFIRGVVNVRGQIVPVIDMKKFFELPEGGIADVHKVILVQSQGMELGIEADAVTGIRSISKRQIQPALPTLSGIRAQYLRGVTDQKVTVLDVAKILGDPRIIVSDAPQTMN